MKKIFTLRNSILVIAVIFTLVTFVLSFYSNYTIDLGANSSYKYYNIIWGCKKVTEVYHGQSKTIVLSTSTQIGPSILGLIGTILTFACGFAAAAFSYFMENEKRKKWILVGLGTGMIIGGIFIFFTINSAHELLLKSTRHSIEEYIARGATEKWASPIIAAIFALVAGCGLIGSRFLPDIDY